MLYHRPEGLEEASHRFNDGDQILVCKVGELGDGWEQVVLSELGELLHRIYDIGEVVLREILEDRGEIGSELLERIQEGRQVLDGAPCPAEGAGELVERSGQLVAEPI